MDGSFRFANHEKSKKHKENVVLLKAEMDEEEEEINESLVNENSERTPTLIQCEDIGDDDDLLISSEDEIQPATQK